MLILLPPSEGKTRPADGPPLDLTTLSSPRLTTTREQLARTLVRVSSTKRATEVLGLGPSQADELALNTALLDSPTARADEVYTGVLFSALDVASLSAPARERADRTLAIASALFGVLRPDDRIPAYRLSGNVTLPRLGTIAGRWRGVLPRALDDLAGDGLIVDLRSGTYVALGKPTRSAATVRVLHESNGVRKVVSHFNKATKGHLLRALLESGHEPTDVDELVDAIRALGWTVEPDGTRLDVVVTEVPAR